MGTTTSPCPSVALADSDQSPLWRFKGKLEAVLVESADGTLSMIDPGRNYFTVVGGRVITPEIRYIHCEFWGGILDGLSFLLPTAWEPKEQWNKIAKLVKDGLPASDESDAQHPQ
jgi:hypothetical protein